MNTYPPRGVTIKHLANTATPMYKGWAVDRHVRIFTMCRPADTSIPKHEYPYWNYNGKPSRLAREYNITADCTRETGVRKARGKKLIMKNRIKKRKERVNQNPSVNEVIVKIFSTNIGN